MRPKPRPRAAAKANRRDIPVPAVPTFHPEDPEPVVEAPAKAEDDPADEAIRRMVEAAYT
jgi:hypothetical protein